MLLAQGYNHLGIQELLAATDVPKGSFYHHFESKEDFAIQVVDRYMTAVRAGLDATLSDLSVAPLERVRNFFEATRDSYRREGYLGCLLGGLGQELSGINDAFRHRIEQCIGYIASRVEMCLKEAIARGDLPRTANAHQLANLLCDCWEGAALRTRLLRDPTPLVAMLEFYFTAVSQLRPPELRTRKSHSTPRRRRTQPRNRRRRAASGAQRRGPK